MLLGAHWGRVTFPQPGRPDSKLLANGLVYVLRQKSLHWCCPYVFLLRCFTDVRGKDHLEVRVSSESDMLYGVTACWRQRVWAHPD